MKTGTIYRPSPKKENIPVSYSRKAKSPISFSSQEKVPEGRMR